MFESLKSRIVPIFFVIVLLLPQTQTGYLIQVFFPFILAIYWNKVVKKPLLITSIIVLIIIGSFLILKLSGNIPLKAVSRMAYLAILFILFPFTAYSKIDKSYLYFAFAVIFISQLVFVFNIEILKNMVDSIWPTNDERYVASKIRAIDNFETGLDYLRFSGLYHNPNYCSSYVTIIYLIFSIETRNIESWQKYLFTALVFISVLITGSRTGLMVFSVLFIYSYFFLDKNNNKRINRIVYGFMVLLFFVFALSNIESRSFSYDENATSSISQRIESLTIYVQDITQDASIPQILFGNFSIEVDENDLDYYFMDSEIGNMFYSLGFFGLVFILLFYLKMYRTKDKNLRMIIFFLLWIFSASILFSYRMSFLYLLVLSNYYSLYLKQKELKSLT